MKWIQHIMYFFTALSLYAQNPLFIPPMLQGSSFTLTMDEAVTEFYPGVSTTTYGYNGSYLGPTLIFRQGDTVQLNVVNALDDEATTHWHGMHVAPEDDGGPAAIIPAGETWSPSFPVLDTASTMWYHPHLHMRTTEQVMMGLAGMILVRDREEERARLPVRYGEDEFPLILQDRSFDEDGQFVHAFLADEILVNGTVDPYLEVPGQLVRFRVLNGSAARGYMLGLDNDQPFHVVGADGGLLERPVLVDRFQLTPGERVDLLVEFDREEGPTRFLMNYSDELDASIPGATEVFSDEVHAYAMLEFKLMRPRRDRRIQVPQEIQVDRKILEQEVDRTRTIRMTLDGAFGFDGQVFDMGRVDQTVMLGDTEIWELVNETDFAHPFHIHDVQFYILDRDGIPPQPFEAGKKDTVLVKGGETVRFITRFEDFADPSIPYMYHCHILPHEDMGMMGQFIVVDMEEVLMQPDVSVSGPTWSWDSNLDDGMVLQSSTDLVNWRVVPDVVQGMDGLSSFQETQIDPTLMFYRMGIPVE